MNTQKGFTLIELLVVISIIGILSTVVIASLTSARTKGADAAIKANLAGMRTQAEIIYDNNASYANVCSDTTITNALNSAKNASGAASITLDSAGSGTTVTCNDTSNAWAAQSPLKSAGFFCVDSTSVGLVVSNSALSATDDTSCSN